MSDEFESLNDRIPDINTVLSARIAARKAEANPTTPAAGTVDPYQLMLQKKQGITPDPKLESVVKWPEADVKKLQDYCTKIGIVGFNCGRMPPLVALAMLKKQYGDYSDTPLEERVPEGYEKLGIKSTFGPNYPYERAIQEKRILHG